MERLICESKRFYKSRRQPQPKYKPTSRGQLHPKYKPTSRRQPQPKYKTNFRAATTAQVQANVKVATTAQVQSQLQGGNHSPSTKPTSQPRGTITFPSNVLPYMCHIRFMCWFLMKFLCPVYGYLVPGKGCDFPPLHTYQYTQLLIMWFLSYSKTWCDIGYHSYHSDYMYNVNYLVQ